MNMLQEDFNSFRANQLADVFSTYLKGFLYTGNPNEFTSTASANWIPWRSAAMSPARLVFGESKEHVKMVYPNPLIGLELLKISGHILTHGFEYRPRN